MHRPFRAVADDDRLSALEPANFSVAGVMASLPEYKPYRTLRVGDVCIRRYLGVGAWLSRVVIVTGFDGDEVLGMQLDGWPGHSNRIPLTFRWTPEQFLDDKTTLITEELHQLQEAAKISKP